MRWLIVITTTLVGLMTLEVPVGVAQNIAPYSTGTLIVTWTRGAPPNAADADRLNLHCGTATRRYTLPVQSIRLPATPADPPDYPIYIRDLLPRAAFPQDYFCVSVGAQGAHESSEVSDEFSFTVVDALAADVTPPTVSISSPNKGAVVERKSTVTIDVVAHDDSGVITDVVIFVNRASICRVTAPPFQCTWEVPAPAKRTYTLQASAGDAAGNRGLSPTIQVRSE
jgi:hypothetical protein